MYEEIIAEIERLRRPYLEREEYDFGWNCALDKVILILESAKPSEDLEKYASRAGLDYVDDIENKYPGHRWNDHDVEFAYRDGIIAGAQWQKEQMIKDAVDAEVAVPVFDTPEVWLTQLIVPGIKLQTGSKAKLIIFKEDAK